MGAVMLTEVGPGASVQPGGGRTTRRFLASKAVAVALRGAGWLTASGFAVAVPASAGAAPVLAPLDDATAWMAAPLPAQKLPPTRFEPIQVEGRPALRIHATGSYGNLVHTLSPPAMPAGRLRWRWRLDAAIDGADLRTKAGDDAAFEALCLAHRPAALRVAKTFFKNEADREDAVQEAFIAVMLGIDGLTGGSFEAWLVRIVQNKCRDLTRKKKRDPLAYSTGKSLGAAEYGEEDAELIAAHGITITVASRAVHPRMRPIARLSGVLITIQGY
jgi:RNA polymerase sigma factor (sigma-70 family)